MAKDFGFTPDQVNKLPADIMDGLLAIGKAIEDKEKEKKEMSESKARATRNA